MRQNLVLFFTVGALFISSFSLAQRPTKKKPKPASVYDLEAHHYDCTYMYSSQVTHLPSDLGDLCTNWAKCVENIDPLERHADLPKGFTINRATACPAQAGRCPDLHQCALSAIKDRLAKIIPNYVLLPKQDQKFTDKKGRVIEFDRDSHFEDQSKIGKFADGKYVALHEKYPPPDGDYAFCSMPLKITGDNSGPEKIPNVVSCSAVSEEGKFTCPTLKICVEKPLKGDPALASLKAPSNSELVIQPEELRPHGERESIGETHDRQGI